ncbi:MAG: CinA family nicotinamide mononucleotide deamidase-related protein [Myxococcaceae bacterium]|nr:CinA family nicotinamide mononucleotide deamidase-related protein [Myxococcaceae bacterium]
MRVETLCTGDELLTGLTADTNSTWFQTKLLDRLGVMVRRSTVVPDLREDIVEALLTLSARADAVLVSGGLGPTADDFTAECAAKAAGVGLVEDVRAAQHIRDRFAKRGLTVTANNLRQAMVPAGAEVILNSEGSAPMFVLRLKACTLFFVPGVPKEYRHLVDTEVLPRLEKLAGARPKRVLCVLKTMGIFESQLDAKVQPLYAKHPRVTFGFRTQQPENHLKLLADDEAALAPARAECLALLGELVFAEGEQTLAGAVGEKLKAKGHRLALAESCTGGLVAAQLTGEPGASAWLESSAVVYSESAKQRWAGVSAAALAEHGAVSEGVALELAAGVRAAAGVEWGGAVTGFAGPTGGTAKDPVGTVYLAVCGPGVDAVERHYWPFDRERVRRAAAWGLMDLLRRKVV